MRVCHVIESAAAGSAGIMLTLAERGVARRQDVTVVYSPVRASKQFLQRAGSGACGRLVPLPMRRAVGPHDLGAARKLRAFLRQERFDVVHSHSSKAGALARLASLGGAGGAVQVYSPHGFVTMGADANRIYGPIERVLSRFCAAIVAVSEKEREHALALGIAGDRLVVVPNGIREDWIVPCAAQASGGDRFTVGFVGRFCDQKDPVLAVEAFAALRRTVPAARLVMVGEGELDSEVRARIAALDLAGDVDLPGACAALPLYPCFDVLLCSSRFEGMPLTFLEALAHAVPIVSTDVGGVDELIDAGETGFVAASTAPALAARLATLAGLPPEQRLSMRRAALAKAHTFSAGAMFERTAALYERCLAQR